ncbi:hypothetical protein QR98_0089470 [Sarcoptes scabiei]|uniref:Uncharacterized protein n=1 Tax=Sarcoptes scabiei TaxID=52283 RepID=A0A132AHC1_SARSC|nr:hypothetical protein QR98_0089470 [Sarcoptes scabiei]
MRLMSLLSYRRLVKFLSTNLPLRN